MIDSIRGNQHHSGTHTHIYLPLSTLDKMDTNCGTKSCPHVESFKSNRGSIKNFKAIYSSFVIAISPEARKRKAQGMMCSTCGQYNHPVRLHACLGCIFFGCYVKKHIHEHAKANNHPLGEHSIFAILNCQPFHFRSLLHFDLFLFFSSPSSAMDLTRGYVYCYLCRNYIYDSDLEKIAKEKRLKAAKVYGPTFLQYYSSWEPTLHDLEVLKQNPQRKRISDNSYIGNSLSFRVIASFIS